MGKSPGKWIKTVLFGKKSSKSNISKAREKLVKQNESPVVSKPSETFGPTLNTFARNERDPELENRDPENLLVQNQEIDLAGSDNQDAPPDPEIICQEEAAMQVQDNLPPDPEKIRQEEAAMKVQATFRGYLARRTFRALKGIIRLQALIRGHLVRRQAIATLFCIHGIIKLQALVRGRRVRQSDVGYKMHVKCNLVKPPVDKHGNLVCTTTKIANLSENSFIHRVLASSTTTMVLRLQHVSEDPNSALRWLERWSASRFWKQVPKPKKLVDSRTQRKLGSISDGEAQVSKSKRSDWKIPTTSLDSVSVQENSEFDKQKRNLRKVSSQPTDPGQEDLENEFEKVKRGLRKVHNPVVENAAQSEVEPETMKQHVEEATITVGYGVLQGVKSPNEKIKMEATVTMFNVPDGEIIPKISDSKEASDMPISYQVPINSVLLRDNTTRYKNISGEEPAKELKDLRASCNGENSPLTNGHLNLKEDSTSNENQKPTQKCPVIVRQEEVEDGLQSSPTLTLPSYMAATESAKAKLRAQGSPRVGKDGGERSNLTRRHSLPSSTNSKTSSHSPKTQKPVPAGGKGGHKSDKPMGSSRGGNGKLIQAEWKR